MNLDCCVLWVNSWLRHDLDEPFLQSTQFTLDSGWWQLDSGRASRGKLMGKFDAPAEKPHVGAAEEDGCDPPGWLFADGEGCLA